jgi:hypothetical protein
MEDHTGTEEPGRPAVPMPATVALAGVPPAPVPLPASVPPAPVPRPETGEHRVDAALSLLDELTERPVTEHPEVFERVHAELSEVLGELGSASSGSQAGRDGS